MEVEYLHKEVQHLQDENAEMKEEIDELHCDLANCMAEIKRMKKLISQYIVKDDSK